jgi:hypothetical protein
MYLLPFPFALQGEQGIGQRLVALRGDLHYLFISIMPLWIVLATRCSRTWMRSRMHVAVDENGHASISPIEVFAAHVLKSENRQVSRKTARPDTEGLGLFPVR